MSPAITHATSLQRRTGSRRWTSKHATPDTDLVHLIEELVHWHLRAPPVRALVRTRPLKPISNTEAASLNPRQVQEHTRSAALAIRKKPLTPVPNSEANSAALLASLRCNYSPPSPRSSPVLSRTCLCSRLVLRYMTTQLNKITCRTLGIRPDDAPEFRWAHNISM